MSISAFAQDTIFTNTSQTLLVRVLEITKTEVTYKNFYNPDGIIRSISNEQIAKLFTKMAQKNLNFN